MARPGKWMKIYIDDQGGTPRDITGDVTDVGELPITYAEVEASGYGEDESFVLGQGKFEATLTVNVTTTALVGTHTVFAPHILAANIGTEATLTIQWGNKAVPTSGDPELEGEVIISSYSVTPDKAGLQTGTIKLAVPKGQALPVWGTVA